MRCLFACPFVRSCVCLFPTFPRRHMEIGTRRNKGLFYLRVYSGLLSSTKAKNKIQNLISSLTATVRVNKLIFNVPCRIRVLYTFGLVEIFGLL